METYGSGLFGEGTWGGRNVIRFTLSTGGQNNSVLATHHGNLPAATITGGGTPAIVGRKSIQEDLDTLVGGGAIHGFIPILDLIPGGGFQYADGIKHGEASVGLEPVPPPGSPHTINGSYYGEALWGEAVYGAGAGLRIQGGGSLLGSGARTNYPRPPDQNLSIDPPLSGGGNPTLIAGKNGAGDGVLHGGGYLHVPEIAFLLSGGGDTAAVARKKIRQALPLLRTGGATHQVGVKRIPANFVISTGGDLVAAGVVLPPGWRISAGGDGQGAGSKYGLGSFASSDGGELGQLAFHSFETSDGGDLSVAGLKQALTGIDDSSGGDATSAGAKSALVDLTSSDGGDLSTLWVKNGLTSADLSGGGGDSAFGTKDVFVTALSSDGGDLVATATKFTANPQILLSGGGYLNNPLLGFIVLTGGGDIAITGVHGGVAAEVIISGGGGCWGPWPEVLYPKVLLINHQSNVATLSTGVYTRTLALGVVST